MERDYKFGLMQHPLLQDSADPALKDEEGSVAGSPQTAQTPPQRGRDEAFSHAAGESEFFSLVSAAHEFKTPLAVMLGYTELLRKEQLGAVSDRQRQVLDEIQESAQRLNKLVEDLLLLCELRSGKHSSSVSQSVSVEVNQHLRKIFNSWEPAARHKSVSYEFRPAAGNARVAIEPLDLQHIVSNLVENALKFTPEHGRVVLSTAACFCERRKAQSHFLFNMERKANQNIENAVCITVSDTGPGIAPEHHERIFADFVQLPQAPSRGMGLGLAIARRLVEAHGGWIWVESQAGSGSKFSVLFSQAGR